MFQYVNVDCGVIYRVILHTNDEPHYSFSVRFFQVHAGVDGCRRYALCGKYDKRDTYTREQYTYSPARSTRVCGGHVGDDSDARRP